jgi:hypothetical protein
MPTAERGEKEKRNFCSCTFVLIDLAAFGAGGGGGGGGRAIWPENASMVPKVTCFFAIQFLFFFFPVTT